MLTFFNLLRVASIEPSEVRLVRHGNKEINVLETFLTSIPKLAEYTAWQKPGKYGDAKYIAVFCPGRGTASIFLGLWKINGCTPNSSLGKKHLSLLKEYSLPEHWFYRADRNEIALSPTMFDLIERLVIDWGKSTVSWVQKGDKPVVEIRPKNSIGEFISYDSILLSFSDLEKVISDSGSNSTWVNALSTVNGVYLVRNKVNGKLYVGSAYGKGGILGRWAEYAKTGHAGNKLLRNLDPRNFEFSVLEISPTTMSAEEVIARENRWKLCLGTREFGLNEN